MVELGPSTLALVLVLAAGCSPIHAPPTVDAPTDGLRTVEEFWPDGTLRLRKQVLRLDDGALVDHGTFERWHDNGSKEYEAVFVHGRKEGTTVRYHKNGQRSSQQEYRNGKRHGRCVSWDASGAKVKEEHWADGRPHGTWTVWKDGEVRWSRTYDHGKPVSTPPPVEARLPQHSTDRTKKGEEQ